MFLAGKNKEKKGERNTWSRTTKIFAAFSAAIFVNRSSRVCVITLIFAEYCAKWMSARRSAMATTTTTTTTSLFVYRFIPKVSFIKTIFFFFSHTFKLVVTLALTLTLALIINALTATQQTLSKGMRMSSWHMYICIFESIFFRRHIRHGDWLLHPVYVAHATPKQTYLTR